MPGIDDVLQLVTNDAEFRARLLRDPRTALRGYDLSASDLDRLARELGAAKLDQAGFLALFRDHTSDA